MAMSNYKVDYAGGETTWLQYEDDDPALEVLKDAAKDKTSGVVKVEKGEPPKTSSDALQKASA